MFEFHIAKQIREKYQLDDALFATDGHVIFSDFVAVRHFVHRVNQQREPEQHIYPGEVNAAGLIDEIYHLILREYERQKNPEVFEAAVTELRQKLGDRQLTDLLVDFIEKFPPSEVYKGNADAMSYLRNKTGTRSNAAIAAEEAMMLYLSNFNPANKKLKEFFDENYLNEPKFFNSFTDVLIEFFLKQPGFGHENQDLLTLLKTPFLKAPDDLFAQLNFILENWKSILPEKIMVRILKGKDLMKEDFQLGLSLGAAPTIIPTYKENFVQDFTIGKSGFQFAKESARIYEEYEAFTPDTHWMPRVVLLAKNTYVWLDQLSKKYQREIRRLDQVPDEELDRLANWNFNSLWLIGIWERSNASKRIKHIMGNIDAVASAYSLYDYEIAADLGGEEAYQNLNERARARGIRLASDMVPNHTGLYSKWVNEKPDYFIQTRISPFPGYRFTGENLSEHPDFEIRIEDGYYSRTDAAVVFQRIDKRSGDVRYIYHGNDGTNMPWNDTAQLDMLKQEVREAVIQKIFEVARRFSIIRFDAAMTLAKKHFSRLWYPSPGSGGDIPSRADFAMSQEEFDSFFPNEFWREVVDRMNQEMPETLLLAEAFWLMEGYFVRTLGMHRVYNSAFMHMLKNEENEKYRDAITNTLEFEPEILKRYVNFMSNPDEETAIRQFGSDDKYFGICVLMATLPGLPMFAHGQVEGYTEKYGMEYKRAYYNEQPNPGLVARHEREIFPLTQKRYIFSEVEHFNIFDFVTDDGRVNENVFAYTNRHGYELALVLFNNKYEATSGYIRQSAPKMSKSSPEKTSVSLSLSDALLINPKERFYYTFCEHVSGLEFLRSGTEIHHQGFSWGLQGFEYRVFIDFKEIFDESGAWEKLHHELNGAGVLSLRERLHEIRLREVFDAVEQLLSEENLNVVMHEIISQHGAATGTNKISQLLEKFEIFVEQAQRHLTFRVDFRLASDNFSKALLTMQKAFGFANEYPDLPIGLSQKLGTSLLNDLLMISNKRFYREHLIIMLAYQALEAYQKSSEAITHEIIQELHLQNPLQNALKRTGRGENDIKLDIILIELLLQFPTQKLIAPLDKPEPDRASLLDFFNKHLIEIAENTHFQSFIGVNEYEHVVYYSKENFEEYIDWCFALLYISLFQNGTDFLVLPGKIKAVITELVKATANLKEISERSGYQFENLKQQLLQKQSESQA